MRSFILGTDWWTDCDDAVAMRILARAHKSQKICIKGIGINACMEYSVKSLAGFLKSEGVLDIPLGIDLEATDFGGNPPYQKRLAQINTKYCSNNDADNAVKLYRKILADAKEPLEIIEIGYLQVFANVLESRGDDISPLSGYELIKQKVSKIWAMAGKWDEPKGMENNFTRNARSRKAGSIFCERCPVPVTFLGWEIGADVITGGALKDGDVLYDALCDFGCPEGRSSWDPMLVVLALIGDEQQAGYDTVSGIASVDAVSGENSFKTCADGIHKYVIKKYDNEYYKNQINEMI